MNTINAFQSLGNDSLKPEEVSILRKSYRFLSVSSSGTDGNKNVLKESSSSNGEIVVPEKGGACGTSSGSKICGKHLHSASSVTYSEMRSRLEDLENRVARNEEVNSHFRQTVAAEVRDQRECLRFLQRDFSQVKVELETLQENLIFLQTEHHRIYAEIQGLLAIEDPVRIRNDLANLVRIMALHQRRVQILDQRSQSLVTMLNQLTDKITSLCLVYGTPDVQSSP